MLWTASNSELVRHDGLVWQHACCRQVVITDLLCVRTTAVWRAMHYLREHTDLSKGDQRSGFAKRSITWVMPSTGCCIC